MSNTATLEAKIAEYRNQLAQDPKSTVFVELSDAYCELGQLDDALEVALKGTWELPQYADGFAAVGRVYYKRQVLGKAEEAFYKALSVEQMCIAAYKGLAVILKDKGDVQKASDILTKAIMLDPGDQSLQQMIESLSAPAASGASAGQVASEPVVAEEPAMDQSSDGMKPITTATIADIYVEQGLYDKAMEVYRELLTENPQDAAVQQKISELEALMSGAGGAPAVQSSAPATDPVAQEPVAPTPQAVDSDIIVDKLNNWLAAIQARRNRV